MFLSLQRSTDPAPYLGSYFRLAGDEDEPTRGSIVLAPAGGDAAAERATLARMLGLAISLGSEGGGAPIRQYWLTPEGRLQGKLDSDVAPHLAAESERIAGRLLEEWGRFLANALARLEGEPRGDAHFRFPAGGWNADSPAVRITTWPPLAGESLPSLS